MNLTRLLFLSVCLSAVASATPIFIQTAAATPADFTDKSRIQSAGTNIIGALTLDGPAVTYDLAAMTLQPFGGTKFASSANLLLHIYLVQENSVTVYSSSIHGAFDISLPIDETVIGGVAKFATVGAAAVYKQLSNGHYLWIKPLANTDFSSSNKLQAEFKLLSAPPPPPPPALVPEPSSFLLAGGGFVGLLAYRRRKK